MSVNLNAKTSPQVSVLLSLLFSLGELRTLPGPCRGQWPFLTFHSILTPTGPFLSVWLPGVRPWDLHPGRGTSALTSP